MFNLEAAIAQWKKSFESDCLVNSEEALELETHLRESTVALCKKDLNQEEAFLVATRRLGHASELGAEFAKTNAATAWHRRILWMVGGCALFIISTNLISTLISLTNIFTTTNQCSRSTQVILPLLIAIIWWTAFLAIAYQLSEKISANIQRIPVVATGAALLISYVLSIGSEVLLYRVTGLFSAKTLFNTKMFWAWEDRVFVSEEKFVFEALLFVLTLGVFLALNRRKKKTLLPANI